MHRRSFLTVSCSSALLGVGGCLDDGVPSDDATSTGDEENERKPNGDNGVAHDDFEDDYDPLPELHSLGWLRHESMHGQHGDLVQVSNTGPMVTDPIESSGELHVLLIDRPMELERNESPLTVDLHQTDADGSETKLIHLGRGLWAIGNACFLPPEEAYQLDVQTEEDVHWGMTVVDPSTFRAESSYETVSFDDRNQIRARGGGNNVFGAARLSPGMQIELTLNNGNFPLSVAAYTETGQREVLFDETEAEGETVETNLDGVAWFDIIDVGEDGPDGWEFVITPEP